MLKIFIACLALAASAAMAAEDADSIDNKPDQDVSGYTVKFKHDDGHTVVDQSVSPVITVEATPAQIIGRAQTCSTSLVSFGKAGSLFETVNPEQGVLVANAQVSYGSALVPRYARLRMRVEGRENRFRITLTEYQAETSRGLYPFWIGWGSGWENGVGKSIELAQKVSDCVTANKPDNW